MAGEFRVQGSENLGVLAATPRVAGVLVLEKGREPFQFIFGWRRGWDKESFVELWWLAPDPMVVELIARKIGRDHFRVILRLALELEVIGNLVGDVRRRGLI
jgi:hypothetical protein